MHTNEHNIHDHLVRTLRSLTLDHNDQAARSKVKAVLESTITGSVVTMEPINTLFPTVVKGTLNHESLGHTLHFQKETMPADLCLVCGESLEFVRVYGCVAGIQDCVYENLK